MRRLRSSLRRRLIVASASAVAVAILLASAITYVVVRSELRDEVDDSLREAARELSSDQIVFFQRGDKRAEPIAFGRASASPGAIRIPPAGGGRRSSRRGVSEQLVLPAPPLGGNVRYAQVVRSNGRVIGPPHGRIPLPGELGARTLARRGSGSDFSDGRARGVPVRVFTQALGRGIALQVARPVDEIDDTLRKLAGVLAAVSLAGVALAGGLALLVSRAALGPLARLSEAAEHVARTRDLSRRMESDSADELGRLASSFNTMLAALERSMSQQRQLVADASHELRTPLTSLRTNVELLGRANGMPAEQRKRLLRDVVSQLEELSVLVGDLVDLARDGEEQRFAEDVPLDELVAEVVERARSRHPQRRFELSAGPTVVRGEPARIDRAVANLIDNAEKWSPPGAPIEVTVADGEVVVRDHGPGVAPEDCPFIFERFYRARSARGTPGSGLGLAIVRHVAETHGGDVSVEVPADGGARFRLRLPAARQLLSDSNPPLSLLKG